MIDSKALPITAAQVDGMPTRSRPARLGSEHSSAPLACALVGVIFVVIGAAGLAALIYVSNSRSPEAERAMLSIGLAGSVLASAIAQSLVVIGSWLIWRAARRRPG